ncbi:porin [Vibrio sp. JC009]|uniref:porin n=1 Tax=Vibrio sp. JC009 TaxID=2912314 RepID=UPI0023B1E8C5|nr:porin [Vibrio sp. JC009]WED20607.1 porin [Vibrio sp. JC009]
MRKTILAVAVAGTVGSVQAAEVYSLDGVTLNISGDVEVQYIKTQSEDQDLELNVADGTFGFDIDYDLTEDVTFGAALDIEVDDATDDFERGDVYISAKYVQAHTLTLGSQSTIYSDAGIGDDYEFGFTAAVEDVDSSGNQVVKYKYDGGEMFYGGIAYLANQNTTDTTNASGSDYVVDGKIGMRITDYDFTFYALQGETLDLDRDVYVLEARYNLGDTTLAAMYSNSTTEKADAADVDIDSVGLTATYSDGGRMKYAAGWAYIDDNSKTETVNDFYVNATYTLTDDLKAYAEVGLTDESNTDTGYVVGMKASF